MTIQGVTAAVLIGGNVNPTNITGTEDRNATIYAGSGQTIALGTVTYGGSVTLTGVVLVNTGP